MQPKTTTIVLDGNHRDFIVAQLFYVLPETLLERLKQTTLDSSGQIHVLIDEYELDELIGTLSSHANNTDHKAVQEHADWIADILERYEEQLKV